MTLCIDINCDLGEDSSDQGVARDLALMAQISSCSIACGGHAGSDTSMRHMVENAIALGLRIGAHPSYPDKENFGRKSVTLSSSDLMASLNDQISSLKDIVEDRDSVMGYVKPHGALYNDMVQDNVLAESVIKLLKTMSPVPALMGLAGSEQRTLCKRHGVGFIAEAFADRRYASNGQLAPRSELGAVIEQSELATAQVMSIVDAQPIRSVDGHHIFLQADSICMHSDTPAALQQINVIREALSARDILVAPSP
jgi:UPF0271 protein